jgi:hypothetical protein
MPPDTPNPASARAQTGLGNSDCWAAIDPRDSGKFPPRQAQIVRRQRTVERVHRLGPAPLFHLLTDLDAGKPVWPTVARYAELPADFIQANGGDRFVPFLHVIRGGGP